MTPQTVVRALARTATATALLGSALAAQANTTVFSDNFDANAPALNAAPSGWTVSNGTVDIIGSGSGFDFLPGNGKYIDLDGSTNQPGLLAQSFVLTAGTAYTASFQLAGNQRNNTPESVTVDFGSSSTTISLPMAAGFTTYTLGFTPTTTASYALRFLNTGNDNQGMLLDNISITAVPEPGTWALMLAGLLATSALARRRQAR
jgi:hypothetical protein